MAYVEANSWRSRWSRVQQREEHWVIADLVGKGGHVRTAPIPHWVKSAVDGWTTAAAITHGRVFRAINKAGRIWSDGMSPKVLWDVVRVEAAHAGIEKLAPHDLRRTCARLCHLAGGELEQIQFLSGHRPNNGAVPRVQAEASMRCERSARHRTGRGVTRPSKGGLPSPVRPGRLHRGKPGQAIDTVCEPAIGAGGPSKNIPAL